MQIFWSSLNQRSGDGWGREAQFNARERRHVNGSIPFTFSVNNNLSFHDLLGVFFLFLNESRVNRYWLLNIPGQPRRLQRRTWMAGPNEWHIFPPPEGRGLLQILVRTWAPPPQDLSQLPQSDQLLYPPSERRKRNTSRLKHSFYRLKLTYTTLPTRGPMKFTETESNVELKRLKIVLIIHTEKEHAKCVCVRRVLSSCILYYLNFSPPEHVKSSST